MNDYLLKIIRSIKREYLKGEYGRAIDLLPKGTARCYDKQGVRDTIRGTLSLSSVDIIVDANSKLLLVGILDYCCSADFL